MGLAGRKQKQRISQDPRNLNWADDASRFGLSYLSKFGWDASQGLGASGEGMRTHLKVQQKLDMMGIGAQHLRDPNGIAWKQNKEFEALLERLNENVKQDKKSGGEDVEGENGTEHETKIDGKMFVRAHGEKTEGKSSDDATTTTVKKRKRDDRNGSESEKSARRKRKEEKKHQKSGSNVSSTVTASPTSPSSSGQQSEFTLKPRPMAHRARIRAAKRIAGKSASAISEILGIAPSSSTSASITPPSSVTPVPRSCSHSLDNLTTSTKSVTDYFKEKLSSLSATSSPSPPTPSAPSGSTTPGLGAARLGTGSSDAHLSQEDQLLRKGVGCQMPSVLALQQIPDFRMTFRVGGNDSTLMEKVERKVERQERQEAGVGRSVCESSLKEQAVEDGPENVRRTSKEKKKKRRRE